MRAFLIVVALEAIKALLLSRQGASSGASGFCLEGTMHPFMTAILLRLTWLDTQRLDSQLDPPHRQT